MKNRLGVIVCVASVSLSACEVRLADNGILVERRSGTSNTMTTDMPEVTVLNDCDDCPQLVVVVPGEFERYVFWPANERGPSLVSIKYNFAIGVSEVTTTQYEKYLSSTNRKAPDLIEDVNGNLPVTDVSWQDAKAYTEWLSRKSGLSYRLPSEAEWEYAARANTRTRYYWGEYWGDRSNCAVPRSVAGPAPVKSYAPNQFGLYDVAGNAYEWTEDCFNVDLHRAPKDGSAWVDAKDEYASCDFRIVHGGSWRDGYRDHGSRLWFDRMSKSDDIGFRVARDIDGPTVKAL